MAQDQPKSALQNILDYTTNIGVPVFQGLVYGGNRASETDIAREQNYYDSLNGSGAPDRAGYLAAARDNAAFLFGSPVQTNPPNRAASSSPFSGTTMILAVLAVVVLFFIAKKL